MISAREVASSLYGALRLARLDAGGMAFFNRSLEGFWRSFFAAVIVAPGYAVLTIRELDPALAAARPVRVFLVEAIAYIIGWVAFPLVMAYVCDLLEREERYIGFIVAYNWAVVVQMAGFLLVSGLASAPFLSGLAAHLLVFAAFLAILFYQWFIARTALGIETGRAIMVVGVDLALVVLIAAVASGLAARGAAG